MPGATSTPKALLTAHGLRPKHHFGQNFLSDVRLLGRIAELCTTPVGGSVVEIGAGLGGLTRALLERAARVVAIERDRDLVPLLAEELAGAISSGRLRIEEADAKTADWALFFEGAPRPHVIAGNLPYQITGPLLERLTGFAARLDRAVVLVQLEVAERLTATPGARNWGALSVFVQAAFVTERAFVVRRGAFYPQPGVDSALVVLVPRRPAIEENARFRALVHAAFAQRRKKLKNAWHGVLGASETALAGAAARAGVSLDARGETLEVAAFSRMASELSG
jgi:16S rRNA (adenine1518-N6/adenine1519-N6)-dimethyltransferase